MQKSTFLRKNSFESSFIKLTFRWLQICLSDLKNIKTIKILLMVDFYAFLKMLHFLKKKSIFLNSPVTPCKIVKCT